MENCSTMVQKNAIGIKKQRQSFELTLRLIIALNSQNKQTPLIFIRLLNNVIYKYYFLTHNKFISTNKRQANRINLLIQTIDQLLNFPSFIIFI